MQSKKTAFGSIRQPKTSTENYGSSLTGNQTMRIPRNKPVTLYDGAARFADLLQRRYPELMEREDLRDSVTEILTDLREVQDLRDGKKKGYCALCFGYGWEHKPCSRCGQQRDAIEDHTWNGDTD